MKNLIRKDILSSRVELRFISVIVALISLVFILFKLEDYFVMISYFILILAPLIYFFNIFNYTEFDYYKSELFYPIKTCKIVLARYISYMLIILVCMMYIALILAVKYCLTGFVPKMYQVNTLGLGIVVTLFYASLILAGSFVLGNDNIKEIGIASFVLTLLPIRFFMEIIRYFLRFSNIFDIYNYGFLIFGLILVSIFIYVLSFFLSLKGFRNRMTR